MLFNGCNAVEPLKINFLIEYQVALTGGFSTERMVGERHCLQHTCETCQQASCTVQTAILFTDSFKGNVSKVLPTTDNIQTRFPTDP